MQNSIELIEKYYNAFNRGDMDTFVSLLDEDVIHDINQGERRKGKTAFIQFMDHMNQCYKEEIRDIVIMSNLTGTHAAAEFMVDGIYLASDKGLPPAHNQKYSLPAGAFFQIAHQQITRITTYYNLQDWLKQVKG